MINCIQTLTGNSQLGPVTATASSAEPLLSTAMWNRATWFTGTSSRLLRLTETRLVSETLHTNGHPIWKFNNLIKKNGFFYKFSFTVKCGNIFHIISLKNKNMCFIYFCIFIQCIFFLRVLFWLLWIERYQMFHLYPMMFILHNNSLLFKENCKSSYDLTLLLLSTSLLIPIRIKIRITMYARVSPRKLAHEACHGRWYCLEL